MTTAPEYRDAHQNRLVQLTTTAIESFDRISARTQEFLQTRRDGLGQGAQLGIQAGVAVASIIAGAFTGGAGGALAGVGSAALSASTASSQMAGGSGGYSNPYDRALNSDGSLSVF